MKHKKAILITAISVVAVLIASYAVWDLTCPDFDVYQSNWGVTLPQSLNFHKKYEVSDFGWMGDGFGYEIYLLKDKNSPFLSGMSSQKNADVQDNVLRIVKDLRAAKKKYPDFSHSYEWKIITDPADDRNKLYIVYDKGTSLLYLTQELF